MGEHGDIQSSEVPLDANGRTYHLCVDAKNIANKIFVVGDPGRTDTVAKFFDKVDFKTSNREMITITGVYKGQPMTVISTGIGTDNVEIVLTELHILNEYDIQNKVWKQNTKPLTIIRIGTCGSPNPEVDTGDMAITSYAVGLDNTGLYYPYHHNNEIAKEIENQVMKTEMKKVYPYVSMMSPEVVTALETSAKKIGRKHATGITFAASGFYGPQGRKVGKLSNILIPNLEDEKMKVNAKGVKPVSNEMESSILGRLCNILGYKCGTICAVLATRAEGKQKFISNEDYGKSVDDCIRTALDAMLTL